MFSVKIQAKASNCTTYKQRHPPRGVLSKRCSDNMQQIYRRTPIPKCDLNKVAMQLYYIAL